MIKGSFSFELYCPQLWLRYTCFMKNDEGNFNTNPACICLESWIINPVLNNGLYLS